MISTITEKEKMRDSLHELKKNKYGLPNAEMQAIVKQEILREYKFLIEDLQAKLAIFAADDNANPSNEDLVYMYNVRRVLVDVMKPALRELE